MSAERNQANGYVRVVRLKGDPNKVDEAIKQWTQGILPLLKKQPGFRGATLTGNRKTGDALSVSYWESETTMKAARGQVRPEALRVLDMTGEASSRRTSARSRRSSGSSRRSRASGRA